VEVPEMWEVERVGGKGEEEVGELVSFAILLLWFVSGELC